MDSSPSHTKRGSLTARRKEFKCVPEFETKAKFIREGRMLYAQRHGLPSKTKNETDNVYPRNSI